MSERASTAVALAVTAGACGAVQPKLNAALGSRLDSALIASMVNFAVALAVVAGVTAARPRTRRLLAHVAGWPVPRWTLSAGLGGATVVLAGAVAVQTIGVAVFSVAFFAGQLSVGLVVDRLGLAPGGARPISAVRIWAVLLALAAVVLTQVGRPIGELAPELVALAVVAGAVIAFQSAFLARIAAATGDPVAATAFNVAVGAVALVAVVATLAAVGRLGSPQWPSEPWLYTGGALGVTVVFTLTVATAGLGVLRATLAMLAAQLVGAFTVDWIVQGEPPARGVLAGSLLVVVAVALVGRRPATVVEPALSPPSD